MITKFNISSIGISFWFLIISSTGNAEYNSEPIKELENKQPRNVILILSDDHRYDFMGFTGRLPWLETPSMDALAREGAYFPNAFVTTSLCSPSRASILTGQYSHSHKVVDNSAPAPHDLYYFPQYLQTKGYQTSFFGKWHMGGATDDPQPGFDHWESFRGQGVYFNPYLNINGIHHKFQDSTYITDLLTEHAIQWLKSRDGQKPFFLYLSHKALHGRILDCLMEEGISESTMVIYMGDNGFSFGEHGLIDKRHFYEESAKVPFLVRCPELINKGVVNKEMVQNIDIAPTILELAGIEKPLQMQGISIMPLLRGEATTWRERIFYEYYWENNYPQTPTMHGVLTDRYKLIRYHGIWDTNEFYDLAEDPYEMNNLIASPQHQALIHELTEDIYDWLENTDGMQIPLKRTGKRGGDHRNRGLC